MITGGWIKDKNDHYVKYCDVKEISLVCTTEELAQVIAFLQHTYTLSASGGETIQQYRDWSHTWKKGDSDIVVSVCSLSSPS